MGDPELLVLEGLAMAMGIFWNESSNQKLKISSLTHPKSLIFGKSKEKTPIYIFTNRIFISPSFT